MNELEKTDLPKDTEIPAHNVTESENECVVNTSPAEELSAVADAQQAEIAGAECAVETSPAEDISAVADAQQMEIEGGRNFHAMTKEELVDAIKAILEANDMEAHKEVAAIKQAFFNIKSKENLEELNAFVAEGNAPEAFSAAPDELENEFKTHYTTFKERRAEHIAAEEARRTENLAKKKEIISKMEAIAGDIDNVNTKFPEFQQLQQDFKEIKEVPAASETEIWKEFQAVVERFYDNLKINKELRDFDFKKNLEAKKALIEEAKKLETYSDPVAAFKVLQSLHDQWRAIGPVAKEIREQLWEEFKEASTVVNKRHQEYFEKRKADEAANEEGKTKLCEEIEAINVDDMKSFNDWNVATDKIIDLQKRWKEFGFASKKNNNLLYNRFRTACDKFFEAKAAYFQKTKDEFQQNLEKKIALCEKAEALKETAEIKQGMDEVVKLQAEWKKIGSVPRKQSDAVWQRFTAACNYFFDERKRQNKERHREEQDNLEKKRAIIAKIAELPKDGDRAEIIAKVKELQTEWQEVGFVPFKFKDKLYEEYRAACDAVYGAYKAREKSERINNYRSRVSELKGDDKGINREREKLLRARDARRQELNTIENNMGFFNVKSSAGNSMVKEMENKIARLRQDIVEIEDKIKLLDAE